MTATSLWKIISSARDMIPKDSALDSKPSPWEITEDSWDNCSWDLFEDSSNQSTAESDWDDDNWSGCPCCPRMSSSDYIAIRQAEDMFAEDLENESYMNAAGRTTMHPFRDIRSASFARKRNRRYNDGGPRTRSVAGRKWEKAWQRSKNKRKKKDTLETELYVNQRREAVWSPGKPKNIEFLVWEMDLKEDFDEWIEDMDDDVIRYEKLHRDADVFESPEPYTETGETFPMWAQRRIAEMRAVKESRIRDSLPLTQRLPIFKGPFPRAKEGGRIKFDYHVYCGSAHTTTLPTNHYDAYGHALLAASVPSSREGLKWARYNPKVSLFPVISYAAWFGEYTWQWHRNASGCWEIGYDDCVAGGIPCPCCNSGSGSMCYPCYCAEFGDEAAPDEQQRCSLVEWVGAEGKRQIADEELMGGDLDINYSENMGTRDSDDEWSFVDEYSGVQSCSSVVSSI